MRREDVTFFADGLRLAGHFYWPADRPGPFPAIVFCAGYTGTKDSLEGAVEALVDSGYGLLAFDHRGWGDSEGVRDAIHPHEQVRDIRAALSYLEGRADIDADRLGLVGNSFGGGNATVVAALDERVRCAVSVLGVGDGHQWLREMRSEWDWQDFLAEVRDDRIRRANGGEERLVDPTESIMIASPERRALKGSGTDARTPFSCAESILEHRPAEFAAGISPRAMLWICAERDTVASAALSRLCFDAAGEPRKLVVLPTDEHYGAYEAYRATIDEHTLTWLAEHMAPRPSVRVHGGTA